MNKYHCYTRCIYAEFFFGFFKVRPIESVASQWKMLVYSVTDSCDLNGKYFPKNCYWVQNEKTITEVCWACISTIMFLIANTWPSVAVRSVQLQLMWNSLPTAVQSSESLDIFSTPPENWTVRAFLQLTLRLSNDFTAAWLTYTFSTLKAKAIVCKTKALKHTASISDSLTEYWE